MKKRAKILYLHIGIHKTGTSALQEFFARNDSALERYGIHYPCFGRNPIRGFAHHWFTMPINPQRPIGYNGNTFQQNVLLMGKESIGKRAILISSETLCKVTDMTLLPILHRLADEIKIIIYLRRQDEFIQSAYNQFVKQNRITISIQDFLKYELEEGRLDYHAICERWSHVFGKENIIVRVYEKEQFRSGNLFSDFLNLLEIRTTEQFTYLDEKVNISFSPIALMFKKTVNNFDIPPEMNEKLNEVLTDYSKKSCLMKEMSYSLFSKRERINILTKYSESNSKVAKEYLGRPDGQLFYKNLNNLDEISKPCKELSSNNIKDVVAFIRNVAPNVADWLKTAISAGMESGVYKKVQLAKSLSPILNGLHNDTKARNRNW